MRRPQAIKPADLEDQALWQSELGRYIEQEADDSVSLKEIRHLLATIPGSLADTVIRERDEC